MADNNQIGKLDLNLLKVFESIYQEQNMSRTAELLHITPSAVSHALKRLREALDDPLFVRSNNQMLPTSVCQRMAPMIIDNLSRLRQILQHWGVFNPQTSAHHFRLGMHYALEPSILPLLARMLAAVAPNTTFASIKVERANLTRALAAGHIDVAFDVALPIKPPVLHKKLLIDEFCVMMKANHPLAQSMTEQSYLAAKHIGVSNRPSGAAVEDILLQQQGFARQIGIRCQNYYAAIVIVAESDYLLTMPRRLATQMLTQFAAKNDVVLHELPLVLTGIETHLYWHAQTEQDEALSWFRQQMNHLFD
ncbi:MAG: LysR family transcriptional regulator [Paraglaciecola sp.]|uniref:LysR family transcriptional regulator n=1 Tax=Paraglaciecola sp. TaxID=1920173 RepID=UPI00273F0649|nr:LysR family transcriptional regulator [Paraglaciecola sp.]MDP5031340.1 LysR family transcriptional regulator [Paraglaciecola sp.]MDP5131702.1 LysR family transcriptional regulator [Paraglaciecola sp.]